MVVDVVAALGQRYHVIGLSDRKVIVRYVGTEPFDAARESRIPIPGFYFKVEPDGRGVARRL
jgi:hypothetical protein